MPGGLVFSIPTHHASVKLMRRYIEACMESPHVWGSRICYWKVRPGCAVAHVIRYCCELCLGRESYALAWQNSLQSHMPLLVCVPARCQRVVDHSPSGCNHLCSSTLCSLLTFLPNLAVHRWLGERTHNGPTAASSAAIPCCFSRTLGPRVRCCCYRRCRCPQLPPTHAAPSCCDCCLQCLLRLL